MGAMTAPRSTSPTSGTTDATVVVDPVGRHAQGTWTPRVVPGSGGRRYLREDHHDAAPAAATAAIVPAASGVTTPVVPPAAPRSPIRYDAVPGAPRRASFALWGPPRPVWG